MDQFLNMVSNTFKDIGNDLCSKEPANCFVVYTLDVVWKTI